MNDSPHELNRRVLCSLLAGTRGLSIRTSDEARAVDVLEQVGARLDWPVHTWSAASGLDRNEPMPLVACLERIRDGQDEALYLLLDGASALGSPREHRLLRELAQRHRGPACVLLGLEHPPSSLAADMVSLQLARPDAEEIALEIDQIVGALAHDPEVGRALQHHRHALARALVGLDLCTAERVLAEAIAEHRHNIDALLATLRQQKSRSVGVYDLLEHIDPATMDDVGGMTALKHWLTRRALALTAQAKAAAIPSPRGLLLVGVQGCGKSLAARACADQLGLPLVRLDPGRLFGSTVGESEANLRRACETAERLAPVVMWIDEIDKGLAGSDTSASDGGTTSRVVGALLTWLAEREQPVFVVATANRIDRLPPELLRRGRLDETFFVDLPTPDEREAILHIHLFDRPARALGQAPPCAQPWPEFAALAREADGFSGAELEAALVEARLEAFAHTRPLAADDFARALAATVPLSRSHPEPIAALRRWAEHGARRA